MALGKVEEGRRGAFYGCLEAIDGVLRLSGTGLRGQAPSFSGLHGPIS